MKKRKIYLVMKSNFFLKEDDIVVSANRPKHVNKNSHWVIGSAQIKTADLIIEGNKREDGVACSKQYLYFIGYL